MYSRLMSVGVVASAVGLMAWGSFQIVARLAFGFLGAKKLDQAWSVWVDIGSEHGIYRGLGALAIGIPLAFFSRALSRVCLLKCSHFLSLQQA